MLRISIILLLAGVLASQNAAVFAKESKETIKGGDAQRLQGTWIADVQPGVQNRLNFGGGRIRLHKLQGKAETLIWDGHFSVNELASPKQMDWTPLRHNRSSPLTNLAIYHLEGDLLIVIGDTEGPRPNAFFSGGGSHRPKTVVYRRIKTKSRDARKRTAKAKPPK